jgi:hypothetical protein
MTASRDAHPIVPELFTRRAAVPRLGGTTTEQRRTNYAGRLDSVAHQ